LPAFDSGRENSQVSACEIVEGTIDLTGLIRLSWARDASFRAGRVETCQVLSIYFREVQRRRLVTKRKIWFWGAFLVLLGLTLACSWGGRGAQVEWKILRAQGFQFSYPSNWNFFAIPAAGEAYALYMPGKTAGTNVVVMRNPSIHADLAELEQKLLEELEGPLFTSSELIEIQYVQLDGRQAVKTHARMTYAATQQDIEAFQVATLLPNGQAAIFAVGIFKTRDSKFAVEVFEKILDSVKFDE
jgi:hypothetical protein